MISNIIYEAQIIGFKEGVKIALVWLVFYSYLLSSDRKDLLRPFYAGLALSCIVGLSPLFLLSGLLPGVLIGNMIAMSFALFMILSGAALYEAAGVNIFFVKKALRRQSVTAIIVFVLTLMFFLPDVTGTAFYLEEFAALKEDTSRTFVSAAAGAVIAALIFISIIKLYRPFWLGSFFALPQFLLFLAMVKLFGSGIKGIAELSLVPSVQRGFMKFIHDFVHQTFVMLMVPDHPLLKKTTWNFIGYFFGRDFASFASLFILLTLPAIFIYHSLVRSLPEPEEETKAARRKIKSIMLSDRRKKAVPVIFFVVFIVTAWFSHGGESISRMYNPAPRPVVADEGMIVIPLKDPSTDLMDGRLYKFSFIHKGEELRIMVIKKSDNSLSVTLDACEICPPVGYGQRGDHVVCIYCSTPIALDAIGSPGGCNPIPLAADIDKGYIRISLGEIIKKWGFINPGR